MASSYMTCSLAPLTPPHLSTEVPSPPPLSDAVGGHGGTGRRDGLAALAARGGMVALQCQCTAGWQEANLALQWRHTVARNSARWHAGVGRGGARTASL